MFAQPPIANFMDNPAFIPETSNKHEKMQFHGMCFYMPTHAPGSTTYYIAQQPKHLIKRREKVNKTNRKTCDSSCHGR